jgi:hypothetical protein
MLTSVAEVAEFRRVAGDFGHFLSSHVWIADGGGTKFSPWAWQVRLAGVWRERRRVVVLKARQLGVSWLAAAYGLWTALTERGALVLLVSQTEADAVELLAKVQFIFDALPEFLRPECKSNLRCLKFPGLHSAVVALPSTRRAGRGRTARLVIADEHAQHDWAEANFAALQPTVEAGGQFLILSTADGTGNLFAQLCSRARGAGGEWHFVFLPYSLRPGRDEAWYERQTASYPQPWMIHQEYPRDPDEAFVQTGRPRFGKEYLDRHRELCREPLPPTAWPESLRVLGVGCGVSEGALKVFDLPQPGHRYFAGADVAEGLEHGDFSDLAVFDADAASGPAEVLSLHGHWEPDVFAELLAAVARLYPGLYGIERNNHGLATVLACRRLGMRGLYAERPLLNAAGREVEPGRPGWLTTSMTKPLMVDELEQALRTFGLRLSDAAAISELVFYQTGRDGSTGAPAGQHDDRVMSRAIAVQMRKHLAARFVVEEAGEGPGVLAPVRW